MKDILVENNYDVIIKISDDIKEDGDDILIDNSIVLKNKDNFSIYEDMDIPEGVTVRKFCYKPEEGFYINDFFIMSSGEKNINNIIDYLNDIKDNKISDTIVFHDEETETSNGNTFAVEDYKKLIVEIWGTSDSRTIEFKTSLIEGSYRPISGVKVDGQTIQNNTTSTNEIWEFDIGGLTNIIMDLTDVSGGNVSVKGKAIK